MNGASHAERRRDGRDLDPILTSVVQKKLESLSREMVHVIERTARSPLLQEGDFSAGILDARHRILCQEEGLPLMTYGYSLMLDHLVELIGDEVYPGDVFVHNDTYYGNNQAQDTAVFKPVFVGDELRFWAGAKGHRDYAPQPGDGNGAATSVPRLRA